MVSVAAAQRIIREHIPSPGKEEVPFQEAGGRVLATSLRAPFPMPRFHNSAMDGFAVRAEDTAAATPEKPVELALLGVVPAGADDTVALQSGQCLQIMTGAPLPSGADAVVKVEDTSGFSDSTRVRMFRPVRIGENVRRQGEEIQKGSPLIPRGTRITTAELGVLATFGFEFVPVTSRVKVAVFVTGDELQEPGRDLKKGQIYNSNLPVIADLAEKAGGKVVVRAWVGDDEKILEGQLRKALEKADLILSTGGVSMGRFDYLRPVLNRLGVKEHFWKVAQKPGKPLFFGMKGDTLIFSLPGNPVSAFIGFMVWVWPVIEQWEGVEPGKWIKGRLTAPFPREATKHRFLFGRAWFDSGELVCTPATRTGSHMLTSGLEANCILMAEPGESPLETGSKISLQPLPWKSLV